MTSLISLFSDLKLNPQTRLLPHFDLGSRSWFKAGGQAELFIKIATLSDLLAILERWQHQPVCVLGGLSNVLIRDQGIPGLTISLAKMRQCHYQKDGHFIFDAGISNAEAFQYTLSKGYTGLEFLSNIPGTLGGAVFMNAGANNCEIGSVLEWVEVVRNGRLQRITDLCMNYRDGGFATNDIIVRAGLHLTPGDPKTIVKRSEDFLTERLKKFPLNKNIGTAGSTFKNPPHHFAWKLIDQAGCRGLRFGQAMISEKHANFLINTGKATAFEIETLGEMVRKKVFENCGILLEWEVKRIGEKKC